MTISWIMLSYISCACLLIIRMSEKVWCCTVVMDEYRARECFNLSTTTVTTVPLPIELTSNIQGNFTCNEGKPYVHMFSCTHYGKDLLWYFNEKLVITFHPEDPVGDYGETIYPEPPAEPLFNLLAVLTQVDNSTVNKYNVPYCASSLIVHPHDVNNVNMIPFNVSCHTYCVDTDTTEVCQVKEYNIAAKPDKPRALMKDIHTIAADNSMPSTSAAVSFHWSSPENNNYTTSVTNYNFTLINANTSRAVITSITLLNSSYTQVVTAGKYTVSVSAIDLCGQESEPLMTEFEVEVSAICDTCMCHTQMQVINGLILGLVIVFAIATLIIISLSCIVVYYYCRQQGKYDTRNSSSYGSAKLGST